MSTDPANLRATRINKARVYFARVIEHCEKAQFIHTMLGHECRKVEGSEKAKWWKEKDIEIHRTTNTFRHIYRMADAKPIDFDSPANKKFYRGHDPEVMETVKREFREIREFGVLECVVGWMDKIRDPATDALPPRLTGDAEEIANFPYMLAGAKVKQVLVHAPKGQILARLEQLEQSDDQPELNGVIQTFRETYLTKDNSMGLTSLPPGNANPASAPPAPAHSQFDNPPPASAPPVLAGADDPKARAQREWRAMAPEQQAGWIDENTFVGYRTAEIKGQIKHAGRNAASAHAPLAAVHPAATSSQPAPQVAGQGSVNEADVDQFTAQARREWRAMSQEERADFFDETTFISFRKVELQGRVGPR